jgi:hypothetical protein
VYRRQQGSIAYARDRQFVNTSVLVSGRLGSQKSAHGGTSAPLMKAAHPSAAPAITVAQLEASYPAYCKALRMLVQDGISLTKIQRTLCWDRLQLLHTTLPRQYRDPVVHYAMVKRDVESHQAVAS